MDRQLPRPVGQRDTAGDAGRRRTYSGGTGEAEIQRLHWLWQRGAPAGNGGGKVRLDALLPDGAADALDLFDRMQLEAVIGVPGVGLAVRGGPQVSMTLAHPAHGGQ